MFEWPIILILTLLVVILIIFAIIVLALMIAIWAIGGAAILILILRALPIKLKPFAVKNVGDKK